MPARLWLLVALSPGLISLLAPPARGQVAQDPEGVYIDPQGVLATKKLADGGKLRDLLKLAARRAPDESSLVYISLPRLFAAARAELDAGRAIPDDLRYLSGLVKLQYVLLDEAGNDLVIAGRAEPYDPAMPGRPLGLHTGRPVLQLDDLVVALRTCGPGRADHSFGCTIHLSAQQMQAVVDELNRQSIVVKTEPSRRREVADKLADAAGLQQVGLYSLTPDSRLAFTCVEADYLLKRLALGLDRSPVPQVASYIVTQKSADVNGNRFWFEAMYEPLLVAADGSAYAIRGQSLQIRTRKRFNDKADHDETNVDPGAKLFADQATKHFDKLARHIPAFGDLANLCDLGLLAALIARDDLHRKANWNLDWILDSAGYSVTKVPVPATARTLVNYNQRDQTLLFAAGGVKLTPAPFLDKRTLDEAGMLRPLRRTIPPDQWRVMPPTPRDAK